MLLPSENAAMSSTEIFTLSGNTAINGILDYRMVVLRALVVLALKEGAVIAVVEVDVLDALDYDARLRHSRHEESHYREVELIEVALDGRMGGAVCHGLGSFILMKRLQHILSNAVRKNLICGSRLEIKNK